MIVWCPLQGRYASEQECASSCAAPEHRPVCVMESVGDVLQHVCPCGGDPSFEMHEQSLLHQTWLRGQARPDTLDTDWSKRVTMPPAHPLPRPRPEELR